MKWITRCPECATVYQVVPDQLQVAKGWLRCGQCQQAFDSTGLILAWSGEAAPVLPDAVGASTQRLVIEDLLKKEDRSEPLPSKASDDLASFEEALASFKPDLDKIMDTLSAAPLDQAQAEAAQAAASPAPAQEAAPPSRIGSVLAAGVLCVGLLAQVLWIERHTVLARWPAMEGPFKAVCGALACQVGVLRDVEAVVIDTSSFIQRDEAHVLTWTVRNTRDQALAMTALELSLQDAQGKALIRRVFLPADVGAPEVLLPGQSWSGELLVRVAPDLPVAGYRVLSFYP